MTNRAHVPYVQLPISLPPAYPPPPHPPGQPTGIQLNAPTTAPPPPHAPSYGTHTCIAITLPRTPYPTSLTPPPTPTRRAAANGVLRHGTHERCGLASGSGSSVAAGRLQPVRSRGMRPPGRSVVGWAVASEARQGGRAGVAATPLRRVLCPCPAAWSWSCAHQHLWLVGADYCLLLCRCSRGWGGALLPPHSPPLPPARRPCWPAAGRQVASPLAAALPQRLGPSQPVADAAGLAGPTPAAAAAAGPDSSSSAAALHHRHHQQQQQGPHPYGAAGLAGQAAEAPGAAAAAALLLRRLPRGAHLRLLLLAGAAAAGGGLQRRALEAELRPEVVALMDAASAAAAATAARRQTLVERANAGGG